LKTSHFIILTYTLQTLLRQAEVQRVVQQLFVVGANIQDHRQTARRVETGTDRVQRQLADGNTDAVGCSHIEKKKTSQ
jgi:hypothetical protein